MRKTDAPLRKAGSLMVAPAVEGIDLFKMVGHSISGWMKSFKMETAGHVRQPSGASSKNASCSVWNTTPRWSTTRVASLVLSLQRPTDYPRHRMSFAIGYILERKPHDYFPDVVGIPSNGKLFIAEAGMEDDKRGDRNQARAEAAGRLVRIRRGVFWMSTEKTLTRQRHSHLLFLHARRQTFPAIAEIAEAVQEVWPAGEAASVEEIERGTRELRHR